MNTAQTLRKARLAAGITQRALAAQIGISPGFLHDVENNRRRLAPKHYAKLPNEVRLAVVAVAIRELEHQALLLRPLLTVRTKADGD